MSSEVSRSEGKHGGPGSGVLAWGTTHWLEGLCGKDRGSGTTLNILNMK